jgi:primosomal protein N' (replication factor Y)
MIELGVPRAAERRVAVAIDAAGAAGGQAFTYHVPAALEPLADGEAVLVEFGRRQALGIVLGPERQPAEVRPTKPLLGRVRADGPLLPPLSLALATWIADHYLAPPALVVRAMLPPGLLERFELVAELRPAGLASPADATAAERDLLDQLADGPRAARRLAAPEGRAALVRRLRDIADRGWLDLEWTLLGASAGPRWERVARLTAAGAEAAGQLANGRRVPGKPLGARQSSLLADLADDPTRWRPAAGLTRSGGPSTLAGLLRRGLVEIQLRESPRRPLASRPAGARGGRPVGSALSPAQADALAVIRRAIAARDPRPLLLDGVTGGGKTAVYGEALRLTLDAGRPGLLLVPEIALALPLVDRLRADLEARVAVVHSGLGDGERADEWRRIRSGDVDIVVGTRLALLAPLGDVGLIVVDEEHDAGYKSDRTPRFQARDGAIRLAELAGAALVLGSATPAIESVGRAAAGAYRRIRLPSRQLGEEPSVQVVDLRAELAAGNRGLLSGALTAALARLAPDLGEQAILVINRRGSASVVLCRDCGHTQLCPDCARPLVYHQAGGSLRCHHCGRAWPMASRCPACGSARIRFLGGGTERLEREVRGRFPGLRVARLDRDVVERRGAAERVIDAFGAGRVDILVGTSLVTKGLDVPGVVLVGVVSADVALNLPDERAAERTYQLLAQAVGRAGRGNRPGRAIIQTYQPDHPVVRAIETHDPESFYAAELDLRRQFGSPPFGRLVKLTVGLADRAAAEAEALAMADRLRDRARRLGAAVAISGPAPAYIARRAERWRFNVVLRGDDPVGLLEGGVGAPWSVDVDPESLL